MGRIVLIDDEQHWRELLGEVLTGAGHSVESFKDGNSAVREMGLRPPDLVILDIRMCPSGRDVFKSLHRLAPDIPVVLCSSYAGYRDDPDFVCAAAFVEKSVAPSELLEIVSGFLGAGGD